MRHTGTRWIPVNCLACNVTHGLTAGAAIVAITAGQKGDTVTSNGNPVCFLSIVDENKMVSNGKAGSRTVDSTWKVGE